MRTHGFFIDGKWVDPKIKDTFFSINPATEEKLGKFYNGTRDYVQRAIAAADRAFPKWRDTPAPERAEILWKARDILIERKEELSQLVIDEMGKAKSEARGDVQEAIDMFEYMAGEGRRLYGHTTTSELPDKFAMTIKVPIGVVGLITPWNFPFAIPSWKIAPAIVAGNTVVFKPSSDTPLCAEALVKILEEAGLPKGVVNMVTGKGEVVGKEIVINPKVHMISFTGSHSTGEWITKNAGVKKVGLELGSKNPIIIMDDADLNLAVDGVIWGAFGTTGQRCTAASRVIIHKKVKSKFEKMLVERTKKLRLGYSGKDSTDVGPLINKSAQEKSKKYSDIGKKEGAKLLCGGKVHGRKGFFFEPTVFTDVKPNMTIAQEEIFGPIVAVISVSSLDEAIEVANNTMYGLSSSIYTKDISNAFNAMRKLQFGLTYINSSTIGSEVHLPFGGMKGTGSTREGGGPGGGIEEFTEVKTVYFDYSNRLQKAQID